jgi:hypothetical protein
MPPRPHEAWVGGAKRSPPGPSKPGEWCEDLLNLASRNIPLRQRCDARGFKPLRIEIIAKQKVAPAFEPQKLSSVDGRT